MRTTLTLDDDVAVKLKAESRRLGRPLKEIVNETLRIGLASRRGAKRQPFKVAARDLGGLMPGLSLDDASGLIEQVEVRFTDDRHRREACCSTPDAGRQRKDEVSQP